MIGRALKIPSESSSTNALHSIKREPKVNQKSKEPYKSGLSGEQIAKFKNKCKSKKDGEKVVKYIHKIRMGRVRAKAKFVMTDQLYNDLKKEFEEKKAEQRKVEEKCRALEGVVGTKIREAKDLQKRLDESSTLAGAYKEKVKYQADKIKG